MNRTACLLLVLPLAACGGGGGAATAPSVPVSATVVDGVTGATVAGGPLSAHAGEAVAVERAGYLRRDTIVPRDGLVSLWPITVDQAYVQTIVYSETAARNRLLRWATTTIPVPRDLPSDVIEAVRPWVSLVPSDSPAVTIVVDPNDPGFATLDPNTIAFAFTQLSDADAHILSTRLVFKSDFDLHQPGNLLHEMGHGLGLHHSARLEDIMFPSTARTTTTFSADERVLLTMMYAHRRSGQTAPDDDRTIGQAATSSSAVIRVISP